MANCCNSKRASSNMETFLGVMVLRIEEKKVIGL